jgi:hypothetical protein
MNVGCLCAFSMNERANAELSVELISSVLLIRSESADFLSLLFGFFGSKVRLRDQSTSVLEEEYQSSSLYRWLRRDCEHLHIKRGHFYGNDACDQWKFAGPVVLARKHQNA